MPASVDKLPSPDTEIVSVPAAVIVPENRDNCAAPNVTDASLNKVRFSKPDTVAPAILPPFPTLSVSVPLPPANVPVALSVPTLTVSLLALPVRFCPVLPNVNVFEVDKT